MPRLHYVDPIERRIQNRTSRIVEGALAHAAHSHPTPVVLDGVQSVTAIDVIGESRGTATATISYSFNDGSTSVERTVYKLILESGILKIDNSTVLSESIQEFNGLLALNQTRGYT